MDSTFEPELEPECQEDVSQEDVSQEDITLDQNPNVQCFLWSCVIYSI